MHTNSLLFQFRGFQGKRALKNSVSQSVKQMEERMSGSFCIKSSSGGTKCGRWNPTTEQVRVLTDLFRSGLRTPSTDQIQKISSQLSFYGKIESKNVFYWFQNHKARERQKRRRVSVDDSDRSLREEKMTSTKKWGEITDVTEPEQRAVIETLQLFPLNSEMKTTTTTFAYTFETEINHPPLDLRLSFM